MNNFDFNREWEFIVAEVHNKKSKKANLIKKEILFCLQILLGRFEIKNYPALKEIYAKQKE